MAAWDSADLLSRFKVLAARPVTDTANSDTVIYSLLTEAQAAWFNVFAAQVPYVLMGAPTLMSTADGGATYTFPGGIYPLAVELYDSLSPARLLKPAAYYDANGDYVWEGNKIRFPQGETNTFGGGPPYARYITPPDVIDAATQPTLVPPHCRLLMVYRAVAEWANRGGYRDPAPFYDLERRFWMGNPQIGDIGALGALKAQNPALGAMAYEEWTGGPLDGVSTGSGYSVLRLGQG